MLEEVFLIANYIRKIVSRFAPAKPAATRFLANWRKKWYDM